MSARDAILAAVRAAQPAEVPLPALPPSPARDGDELVERFSDAVRVAAGEVVEVAPAELAGFIRQMFGDARVATAAESAELEGADRIDAGTAVPSLADIDVLLVRGVLGVAENGAIWLPESRCGHRAAPFLASHVVALLHREAIVPTMHEAYARIDAAGEGFGLFLAGPSKTADIEQALVIGAHGALTAIVVLEG